MHPPGKCSSRGLPGVWLQIQGETGRGLSSGQMQLSSAEMQTLDSTSNVGGGGHAGFNLGWGSAKHPEREKENRKPGRGGRRGGHREPSSLRGDKHRREMQVGRRQGEAGVGGPDRKEGKESRHP